MNNELNALVNELNFKTEVLDTKTNTIVEGIKSWCLEEKKRIESEFAGLVMFANDNFHLFFKKTTPKCWGTTYRCTWNGLKLCGNYNGRTYEKFTEVCLETDWEYAGHFGQLWSNLPKPMKYDRYQFFSSLDMNNTDVTYWTDYKRCLAIWNEYLCETTKKMKDYLGTLILEQNNRFEEMTKACEEIDEDNMKTIEIKVKVRV